MLPLEYSTKCSFHQKWECLHHFVILNFFIVVFANTVTCPFCIIYVGRIDVVYVNSVRYKHIDSSYHFLKLNYKGCNINFLKLKQLLIDGDMSQIQDLHKMIANILLGNQRKSKCSKEQQKSMIVPKTILMFLVIQRYRNIFSIQFNQSAETLLSHSQLITLALWSQCKNWNWR